MQDEILLVFAGMNLKKMALWIAKPSPQKEAFDASDSFNPLKFLYIQFINKIKNGAFQPKWLKYPILSIIWKRFGAFSIVWLYALTEDIEVL